MSNELGVNTLDVVIGGKTNNEEAATGMGCLERGDRLGAAEAFRKAVNQGAGDDIAFRLAFILDQLGEEDEAVGIYEKISSTERPHINSLYNLAVIYEDRGDYHSAERKLKQILDTDPTHKRACLAMKDVIASQNMYYDEEEARDQAKQSALFNMPVTDFELSVRARNCLRKMNIRTLGDLLKVTETELLSYKNFGDTSLVEIKEMLTLKGLRLGQSIDLGGMSKAHAEVLEALKGEAPDHILSKPISQLDLSVRARKALQQLGIGSVGELAIRTEAELMGIKNFGATSLVEIKEVLSQFGLGFRKLS